MDYDYARLVGAIVEVVGANGPTQARMLTLIDHCESQIPHFQWSELRELDYEADESRLQAWLSRLIRGTANQLAPKGLWFGLFNTVENDIESADIYAGCCSNFVEGKIEWASKIQSTLDLESITLHNLHVAAYREVNCLGNLAEYPLALAYGGIVTRKAVERCQPQQTHSSLQGAAVGFDSGDALSLGRFSEKGFRLEVAML